MINKYIVQFCTDLAKMEGLKVAFWKKWGIRTTSNPNFNLDLVIFSKLSLVILSKIILLVAITSKLESANSWVTRFGKLGGGTGSIFSSRGG